MLKYCAIKAYKGKRHTSPGVINLGTIWR